MDRVRPIYGSTVCIDEGSKVNVDYRCDIPDMSSGQRLTKISYFLTVVLNNSSVRQDASRAPIV